MTDTKTETRVSDRMMVKLLRVLMRGSCTVKSEDGDRMCALSGNGQGVDLPLAAVRQALSLGLAVRKDAMIAATPAGSAFVRRALAGGEAAFQDQHRDMVEQTMQVEGKRQPVRRNLSESPLAPLLRLKGRDGKPFLPAAAVDAGERLLCDFNRGQMQPRITSSWEPRLDSGKGRPFSGGVEIADSAMAARDRCSRAVEAMGPELAGVAVDVCCFAKGLETVERERSWPARSAKLMLRAALLALARHYAPPQTAGRRRHHWGTEDFRPEL